MCDTAWGIAYTIGESVNLSPVNQATPFVTEEGIKMIRQIQHNTPKSPRPNLFTFGYHWVSFTITFLFDMTIIYKRI